MKVLIEASEAYRNTTGIGRYSRALIEHQPAHIDYVFSPPDYAQRTHMPGVRTVQKRLRHFSQHIYLTQIAVHRAAARLQPDVIHTLSFFVPLIGKIPTVATIFDLAYYDLPDQTDRYWGAYARRMMPHFVQQAAAIVTPSATTRQAVIDRFQLPPTKVYNISAGISPQFAPVRDTIRLHTLRQRYNLQQPFVLYAGAWGKTKDLPTLLRACQHLSNTLLVITGEPHTDEDAQLPSLAHRLGVRVRFTGWIPTDDLIGLYTTAHVLVLPSHYEGFGLPMIEAMACGTPVITTNIPVLREITGGHALYFPPGDDAALHEQLQRVLNDTPHRDHLREIGIVHARQFTWEATTARLARVWREVASLP